MCLYVRELSMADGRQLQQVLRRSKNRIKVRRAQVVLASAQGSKVPAIAAMLGGADGWQDVERFGRSKEGRFR